ncbi:MAG: hypothetical protein FJ242_10535 [Nitrospira sp.]|nr:hypothetical protein [Nitrospira sp.]
METLGDFVIRFCSSVGCYYHPNQSTSQYSLKKNNSNQSLRMGVFGWVREIKRKQCFEVSSYKDLGDKAGVSHLADRIKPRYVWEKEGLLFYVKSYSQEADYQKTVFSMKAVLAFVQ